MPGDPSDLDPRLPSLCKRLTRAEQELEEPGAWPSEQLDWMSAADVLRWTIPAEFGGSAIARADLAFGYEVLGAACLTTTFVLTQRNAAIARIGLSENEELKRELLTALCTSDVFATVGISHLTTSRQHLDPVVRAVAVPDGFRLTGQVPWVTGAPQADEIVTGATLPDGTQVLVALPTRQGGVRPLEPSPLLALNASQTASVELDDVLVPAERVLSGPIHRVMQQGSGGGPGSLTTSSLALGHARGAIARLSAEASNREDLAETSASLEAELQTIRADLYAGIAGARSDAAVSAESVRQRANSLVLRATQAYLAASKGAGFAKGHPAERLVREAMFFLVWSCPQPVLNANLREFACLVD